MQVRALLEPSSQQRAGLRRFLGRAALDAAKGQLAGPALPGSRGARALAAAPLLPLGRPPSPGSTPVVGVHLRLQEQISTDHDVNWVSNREITRARKEREWKEGH